MGTEQDAMWAIRRNAVEKWEASGLSMAEFCRREAIVYSQFIAWRKRLSPPSESSSGFAELVLAPGSVSHAEKASIEIAFPGGIVVRVFSHADMALLRAALEAVRGC